jgi:hypothetical protein
MFSVALLSVVMLDVIMLGVVFLCVASLSGEKVRYDAFPWKNLSQNLAKTFNLERKLFCQLLN